MPLLLPLFTLACVLVCTCPPPFTFSCSHPCPRQCSTSYTLVCLVSLIPTFICALICRLILTPHSPITTLIPPSFTLSFTPHSCPCTCSHSHFFTLNKTYSLVSALLACSNNQHI